MPPVTFRKCRFRRLIVRVGETGVHEMRTFVRRKCTFFAGPPHPHGLYTAAAMGVKADG